MSDKIQISWSELKTSKVEKHVRQQQAMVRNRKYAQMTTDDLPTVGSRYESIWYNAIFLLAAFGLLGGLLAWAGGALMNLKPDLSHQADQTMIYIQEIRKTIRATPTDYGISPQAADAAIHSIMADAGDNPYLTVQLDDSLGAAQKKQRLDELAQADQWRNLLTHVLGFGLCGLFISVCLSIAEPVVDRNIHAIVINGSIGAGLGLVGGLAASLVVDRIYHLISGTHHGLIRQYLAQSMSWSVLGCFVAIAPGVVTKNLKRLYIGLVGGAIGGAVGGILLGPVTRITSNPELGRLCAMCCIGFLTGGATGIIERAARAGWLKVTAGLIAGKQFILYRNPTYIGSAPDCQIYLFKDPKVGRRHAAIHLLKGRIEIEDLPLGGVTLVNGQRLTRRVLHDGDVIGVGATTFLFQEKVKEESSQVQAPMTPVRYLATRLRGVIAETGGVVFEFWRALRPFMRSKKPRTFVAPVSPYKAAPALRPMPLRPRVSSSVPGRTRIKSRVYK